MKPFVIIVLLVIFSTADAYGFLNKDKGKKVAKNKKSSQRKESVAVEKPEEPQQIAKSRKPVKPSVKNVLDLPAEINNEPPKVKKATVDKLHLIEKQHYHGNRELLIKHLQRQIELKKKLGTNEQSTNNAENSSQQASQEASPKYNIKSTKADDNHQLQQQQQNNHVKRSPSSQQRRTLQQKQNINLQQPIDIGLSQQSHQTVQQHTQLQDNIQQYPQQSNIISTHRQVQQLQNTNTINNLPQHQSNVIMQQNHNQQQLQNQHNTQHSQQSRILAQQHGNSMNQHINQQQFIPQQQHNMQHIQQQSTGNIGQEISHIEQSFLPQQDLLQIQNQFQNRNNVQPQMHMQPMDMHKPINILQNGNPSYQSHQSQAKFQVQQPQLRIQTLHQQPSNQMANQLQLQQRNANQASMQNQHILMPINSISMDSILSPNAMKPERYILVKNNNLPSTTTPKPTTTTMKTTTTTTTTTTPRPTTTTPVPTTTPSEQDHNVKRVTKSPSMKQKFFEKEMRKQDLEIIKLELEIRALKRIEQYGSLPKELELEAARRNTASATQTPTTTTTTMHPFLDFGKNKLKFPFDF